MLLTSDELIVHYLSVVICAVNGLLRIDIYLKLVHSWFLYYLWKVSQNTCESSVLEFFRKCWVFVVFFVFVCFVLIFVYF